MAKKVKSQPLNPWEKRRDLWPPPIGLSAGQYVSAVLDLPIFPSIQPEEGDNVYAMWLRGFAEKGEIWPALSLQDQQDIALDLYLVCLNRAITLGPASWLKTHAPPMSEAEFEAIIQELQKRCGFKEKE